MLVWEMKETKEQILARYRKFWKVVCLRNLLKAKASKLNKNGQTKFAT